MISVRAADCGAILLMNETRSGPVNFFSCSGEDEIILIFDDQGKEKHGGKNKHGSPFFGA
jgi:hypothetical protein